MDGGKEAGRLRHDGRAETVGFSADGRAVVTGSADTTLLLWTPRPPPRDLPRQAAELVRRGADALYDLAGDAGKAGRRAGNWPRAEAVPFLGEWLRPT